MVAWCMGGDDGRVIESGGDGFGAEGMVAKGEDWPWFGPSCSKREA